MKVRQNSIFDVSDSYIKVAIDRLRPKADGIHCINCGTTLPKKRRTFCSDKCYKENFDKFDWNTVKNRIMERDGHKCKCNGCQKTIELSVHHIKPVRQFPELVLEESNLITLCRYHHEFHEKNTLPKDQILLEVANQNEQHTKT